MEDTLERYLIRKQILDYIDLILTRDRDDQWMWSVVSEYFTA